MNIEEVRAYALSKPGVTEDFPFDPNTLVFRIGGKIFMFLPLDSIPPRMSLKNLPETNIELREIYPDAVEGAYHLNKKHWNQVDLSMGWDPEILQEWIDTSYRLIFLSLPKKEQAKYNLNSQP